MEKDLENIKFGKRIIEIRHVQGLSQEGLALKCNINRTYMGELERGEKSPSLVTIAKIAKGLNITKHQLFDYE